MNESWGLFDRVLYIIGMIIFVVSLCWFFINILWWANEGLYPEPAPSPSVTETVTPQETAQPPTGAVSGFGYYKEKVV